MAKTKEVLPQVEETSQDSGVKYSPEELVMNIKGELDTPDHAAELAAEANK